MSALSVLRVVVADDSEIARAALKEALELDGSIAVVGQARDGLEALRLVEELRPDLVTVDLSMPRQGGLETIEKIMRTRPTPIVVVTDRAQINGVETLFASLSRGALDLIPKSALARPGGPQALILKIKQLVSARASPQPLAIAPAPLPQVRAAGSIAVIGIGASTGGPGALSLVLGALPRGFPVPLILVQHMDEQFHDGFVQWLSRQTRVQVRVAKENDLLAPGVALVAPPGFDCTVDSGRRVRLVTPAAASLHVPSVDALLTSLSAAFGSAAAGVLLTGMGADGSRGMLAMQRVGGLTIAQDRATSVVHGMPGEAIALGAVEAVLPLPAIGRRLSQLEAPQAATPSPPAKAVILLVDDSPIVLEAGALALEAEGYEVITADNPILVANLVRKRHVDLALIDVNMPAIAGDVVIKILLKSGLSDMRVTLYSDEPEPKLAARARACGAHGYARKGNGDHLVKEVARLLQLPGGPTRANG